MNSVTRVPALREAMAGAASAEQALRPASGAFRPRGNSRVAGQRAPGDACGAAPQGSGPRPLESPSLEPRGAPLSARSPRAVLGDSKSPVPLQLRVHIEGWAHVSAPCVAGRRSHAGRGWKLEEEAGLHPPLPFRPLRDSRWPGVERPRFGPGAESSPIAAQLWGFEESSLPKAARCSPVHLSLVSPWDFSARLAPQTTPQEQFIRNKKQMVKRSGCVIYICCQCPVRPGPALGGWLVCPESRLWRAWRGFLCNHALSCHVTHPHRFPW